MSMTFTPRTGPSMVTKIHYKKFRIPRKKKKALKKRMQYEKEPLLRQELLKRITEAAHAITKYGRISKADYVFPNPVYAPYLPMVETIQIDPKNLDISKYSRYVSGTFYIPPSQEIIIDIKNNMY